MTRKNILEIVGIDGASVRLQSSCVQKLLTQIDAEIYNERMRQQERDGKEMLEKVQKAIQQLQSRRELVTYQAVAKIVGVSSKKFTYYPQVQVLLEQHAHYQHHLSQQSRLRQDEIVTRVQRAIQQLNESQQRVTQKAVCKIAGISTSCFTTYPCIRTLLEQNADHRHSIQLELIEQRENELLVRVEEAVRELHSHNQRVTQVAIAAIVGMSSHGLKRYPRVRAVLVEKAGLYHHNTRMHSQVRENELAAQVKAAKEVLESSGHVATQVAVGKLVGLTPGSLMRYPNSIGISLD